MLASLQPDGDVMLSVTRMRRNGQLKIAGKYVDPEEIHPYVPGEQSDSLASVSRHVVNSMLCAGVRTGRWDNLSTHGRHSKAPEAYQLLPMDLLQSPWLGGLLPGRFPRTRLLIADEGGLGKTLAASLAVANAFYENRGVILVLCPPAVKKKWANEIGLCMRNLSGFVSSRVHANELSDELPPGVYVISKHAVSDRWRKHPFDRDWIPKTELVVIDEAHQGSPPKNPHNPPSNIARDSPLWTSQKAVCGNAKRAIAATASPLQSKPEDLLDIFEMMGGECADSVPGLRDRLFNRSDWQDLFRDWNAKLVDGKDLVGGGIVEAQRWIDDSVPQLVPLLEWMEDADVDDVKEALIQDGAGLMSENPESGGHRLLRDLHPFGRFFSIVRRADLGPRAGRLFRDRTDEYHRIELGPEHRSLVDHVDVGRRFVASWAGNISHHLYDIAPSGLAPTTPSDDSRWPLVLETIREERENLGAGSCRGVAIFVDFIGTLEGMEDALESEFGDEESILILSYHGGLIDDEKSHIRNHARKQSQADKLPILICTSAAEVGIDLEWATVAIMWDVNSNPETLSQRTWRLDRRRDLRGASPEFRIIHIQNESNQGPIGIMNAAHQLSSLILGRGHTDFIPASNPSDPVTVPRNWPDRGGVFALTGREANEIATKVGIAQPNAPTDNGIQSGLEIMFWTWVSELTGGIASDSWVSSLPIDGDLLEEGFVSLDDSAFVDGDSEKGIRSEVMRLVWSLSNICSESEMTLLWRLSGTRIDVDGGGSRKHQFGLRYGNPGFDHRHGSCSINREGVLSSRLRGITMRSVREQGLLEFGPGSCFLGWHQCPDKTDIGTSMAINEGWLELCIRHRHLLWVLGAHSPLMVCDKSGAVFLEKHKYWESAIRDATGFSFDNREYPLGLYFGEAPPKDGPDWPTISKGTISSMEGTTSDLVSQLMQGALDLTTKRGSHSAGISELYSSLAEFEFNESEVVPLCYFGAS